MTTRVTLNKNYFKKYKKRKRTKRTKKKDEMGGYRLVIHPLRDLEVAFEIKLGVARPSPIF
jgi:CelD/BcsL family acetyltransferase involved in cellulose biosynthesis